MTEKDRPAARTPVHAAFHVAGHEDEHDHEDNMIAVTASKQQRDAKKKAEDDKKKNAGFYLGPENDPLATGAGSPSGSGGLDTDLKGGGWIKCPDGKMIKDNGGSIFIKGRPPSPAQIQMVMALANERGWDKLALWKPGCRDIDPEVTQMFESRGRPCCHNRREAGSFTKDCKIGMDLWREKALCDRAAAKQADDPKAAPLKPA